MKKVLIIIITLAILLTIPSYFVGSKTEVHLNKLMTMSNNNPNYKLSIVEYNKGWFSSTAKVDFELTMDLGPEVPKLPKLLFIQEMQHGPLLWTSNTLGFGLVDSQLTIELPAEWQSELDKIEAINEDTFNVTSRTSFDGSTISYLEMAEIVINEENVLVTIKPALANFSYDLSGHVTGTFDWAGMSVGENDKNIFTLNTFHAESDQKLIKGELFSANAIFSGSFDSTIKSIVVNAGTPSPMFKLSDLGIGATSEVNDELIDVNVIFTVAEMEGMNLKLTDAVYDTSILNLDINVMLEFNELLMEMQQKIQQEPTLAGPAMFTDMQNLIPKFLAANPVLKVNALGVNTAQGRIDTEAEIIINPDHYDASNLESLMLALEVDASGQAPEAFFANFGLQATIDQLIQQNMLIREDEVLKLQFSFSQGTATVNGNPIPLGDM